MQNSIQFPYPFTSFNLSVASMFDLSLATSGHGGPQIPLINNNNGNSLSPPKSPESPGVSTFESAAAAMSHFLFPPAFLSHSFPSDDSSLFIKEKNKKGPAGKSFTIDSLLGLNRAAIHGGIHHHPNFGQPAQHPINGINLSTSWKGDGKCEKKNHAERFNPYSNSQTLTTHNNPSNMNNNNKNKSSQSSDKSVECSPVSSRRAAKAKRVRTIFTPEQLERLEAEFERQQYMVGPERLYLASSLHLTEAQVKVWFQNRRIKWRKQHLELQQQRLAALRSQDLLEEEESSSEFGGSSSPLPGSNMGEICSTTMTSAVHRQKPNSPPDNENPRQFPPSFNPIEDFHLEMRRKSGDSFHSHSPF